MNSQTIFAQILPIGDVAFIVLPYVVNLDAAAVTAAVENLRVSKRPNSTFRMQGISPSPSTTAAQVQTFLNAVTGFPTTGIFVGGPATYQISYSSLTCNTIAAQ